MKLVNILGATGSIGDSALNIIRCNNNLFKVNVLTASSNIEKLAKLVNEFLPKIAVVADESKYKQFKELINYHHPQLQILSGEEGLIAAASQPCDLTLSAIMGFAALKPTIAAIANSNTLALANKESIVCGGSLILGAAQKHNTQIIPVDSEHNALFQVFEDNNASQIDQITITASGGPFNKLTLKEMDNVTPAMALKHPNWSMGAKITIDSATLANKGLEFIEACILFSMDPKKIKVLVHPESILHAMIHYSDGSVLAQLSNPDMRTPIANALFYPKRLPIAYKPLDLALIGTMNFSKPDTSRFPMLKLAQDCLELGQDALITFNTSNEYAVNAFLQNKIGFNDIFKLVNSCVENKINKVLKNLNDVIEYNKLVEQQIMSLLK